MTKALNAFRTISEVADELDVQKHVLRFWENKFPQVRPMKRGGGRRFYRPDDLDLLRGIRFLLHREGYTIKGVQKLLREQGLDYVKACWQGSVVASVTAFASAPEPAKPGRKPRPTAMAGAVPGAGSARLSSITPLLSRDEHLAKLQALVIELEDCRRILRGEGGARSTPQRASQ